MANESGQAIPAATVTTQPLEHGLIRIDVQANGYYPSIHTVHESDSPAAITLVEKKPGRRLLVFAGDAMLARRYFEPRADEPAVVRRTHLYEDGQEILRHVRPYVQLADIASVNLETQLATGELSEPLPKLVTFYSPAVLAKLLEWTGFDYVALGNNHTYDFRDPGIRATESVLQKTTLGYSGMGLDESSARAPYRTQVSSTEFAFLSYVGWPGGFSPHQVAEGNKGGAALGSSAVFIEDLQPLATDTVAVLQYHSGLEYAEQPAMSERTRLRTAIDAGADLVIGHHAHVLQGLDIHNGRLIAYSMGNFLFDQYHYATQMGMLLYVWMNGSDFHRAEIVPLNINAYVPMPATRAFAYAVLNRMARLSRDNGLCLGQSGMHGVVTEHESCTSEAVVVDPSQSTGMPVNLWKSGVSPVRPRAVHAEGRQYRAGTDLLRRGDFETANRFGTTERAWLTGEGISIVTGAADGNSVMKIEVPADGSVMAGMKVFERTFRPSNPATVSGRVHAPSGIEMRFFLQRRRNDASLSEALADGPLIELGTLRPVSGGWQDFYFDHTFPRISTRSIRLLIEVSNSALAGEKSTVLLDDLGWIEWHSPWLEGPQAGHLAPFATHLQLRPKP